MGLNNQFATRPIDPTEKCYLETALDNNDSSVSNSLFTKSIKPILKKKFIRITTLLLS